jgi:membrane-bound serine protease (ClpP class)
MLSQVEAQYALLAFVLGIGLLVIEAFVIPGFGVAGIAGIGCIIYSVFFIFENAYQTEQAIFFLGVSVLITTALLFVAVYFLPKTRAWQHLVLQTEIGSDKGFHSAVEDYSEHLGQTGVALTALRPAGTAIIENKRLDVVSVGDFIDVDMPVRIVGVEGSKIVVEESRQDKV